MYVIRFENVLTKLSYQHKSYNIKTVIKSAFT